MFSLSKSVLLALGLLAAASAEDVPSLRGRFLDNLDVDRLLEERMLDFQGTPTQYKKCFSILKKCVSECKTPEDIEGCEHLKRCDKGPDEPEKPKPVTYAVQKDLPKPKIPPMPKLPPQPHPQNNKKKNNSNPEKNKDDNGEKKTTEAPVTKTAAKKEANGGRLLTGMECKKCMRDCKKAGKKGCRGACSEACADDKKTMPDGPDKLVDPIPTPPVKPVDNPKTPKTRPSKECWMCPKDCKKAGTEKANCNCNEPCTKPVEGKLDHKDDGKLESCGAAMKECLVMDCHALETKQAKSDCRKECHSTLQKNGLCL